jgi:SAM-dependent methyltransferase
MKYDTIGRTYTATRQPDPRIAARIRSALGQVRTVLNVGAGAGSYEPDDCDVVAIDPSLTMLRQRAADAAPSVQGVAESLPFADGTFDAALAVLTVHHWHDLDRGLREMQRVARRQVVLFFEPSWASSLWLVTDYFPEIAALESEQTAPGSARLAEVLDVERIETVPVPADCVDGFGGCFWNRPERYLDPDVQAGMSCFAQLDPAVRAARTEELRADLASGAWDAKHGALREMDEINLGYRLIVAGLP